VVEPAVWSGHAGREVDSIKYGAYGFDVRDAASKTLLYSRGFGSILRRVVLRPTKATKMTRTFHESVRFPDAEGAGHGDDPQAHRQRRPTGATCGRPPSIPRTCS
jgi:hypothetical protein